MASLDPTFNFGVTGMGEFDELLRYVGIKLEPDQLLFVSTFYFSKCLIRYFTVLQMVFPAR
jgi:hypothetical protein